MKDYLFVYGTLAKENAPRTIADTVRKLKYVGKGSISGRLYDLGEYPGAILGAGAGAKIFGEIYELPSDPKLLNRLDAYEDFDPKRPAKSLFVRRKTSISRPNRKRVKGWVYEYNRDVGTRPRIENERYSGKAA